jgi:hypothetical protein
MDLYCGNCGTKNESSAQFCGNCGRPLPSNRSSFPHKGRTWISKAASIGATIVIIFFFLPWVSVSCSMLRMSVISVSGYQVASGHMLDNLNSTLGGLGSTLGGLGDLSGLGGMDTSGISDQVSKYLNNKTSVPAVWLILVIGVLGIFSLVGGKGGGKIALGVGVIGVIALIVLAVKISGINSQIAVSGFSIKTEGGLVMEWLGFLFMSGAGILSLMYDENKKGISP